MLVFSWIILSLSAILLLLFTIGSFVEMHKRESARWTLSLIVPLILWILGCVWYIFDLSIIPYDLVIGAALGASVFYTTIIIASLEDGFNILLIPSLAATVFFVLTIVL